MKQKQVKPVPVEQFYKAITEHSDEIKNLRWLVVAAIDFMLGDQKSSSIGISKRQWLEAAMKATEVKP